MLKPLKDALGMLTPRERWLLAGLFVISTLAALVEVLGVVSILPFLAVAGKPEMIHTNAVLNWVNNFFGFESSRSFLIFSGIATACAIIASNTFNACALWYRARFSQAVVHRMGERLFQLYLGQEYPFFLRQNTAILQKNILHEVSSFELNFFSPASVALSRGLSVSFIIAALAIFNWQVALVVSAVIGGLYAIVFVSLKNRLTQHGKTRWAAYEARTKLVLDSLNGIKDVKLSGCEAWIARQFRDRARQQRTATVRAKLFGSLPRFLVETVAFCGVVAAILVALVQGGELTEMIPAVGLYGFAGYRLMPSMTQIYGAVTQLRFAGTTIERLAAITTEARKNAKPIVQTTDHRVLHLRGELRFRDVSYVYPQSDRPVLHHADFSIPANSSVGFVGSSGAGKTTLMDLCLGLLRPTSGAITVDGVALDDTNLRAWQNNIGYVSQQIFLNDSSVAESIAFGLPKHAIDSAKVERAAKRAQLHEFIVSNLPHGYDTLIGDRGIRLSGGQRQRIAIARALYHDPEILFFDEATSALDAETEEAIVDSIRSMAHARTIFMIAHRLTSLRGCDVIYVLNSGRIARRCSYNELLAETNTAET